MPTYEYECSACGATHEVFQSMADAPKKKCPKCGKNKLQRLIGAGAGFIFKGSGFYITDYRSSDYQAKAKADSESSSAKPATSAASTGKSGSSSPPAPAAPKSKAKKKD